MMTKEDWLDYFQAVNGREPSIEEFQQALADNIFVSDETVKDEVVLKTTLPVNEVQTTEINSSESLNQTTYAFNQARPMVDNNQNNIPKQPSATSLFFSQYWNWLQTSWKKPTSVFPSHKYNGITTFLILVLLTSFSIAMPIINMGYMTFSGFITIFISLSFIYFAFIFGGFLVKKFIYKEESFTLLYSFEWFGRLLSLNVPLLVAILLFTMLGVTSFAMILTVATYFIFVAASNYTLFHATNYSQLDMFYKYLFATLLFGIVIAIFFVIGGTIAGELLIDSISNNINNMVPSFFSNYMY